MSLFLCLLSSHLFSPLCIFQSCLFSLPVSFSLFLPVCFSIYTLFLPILAPCLLVSLYTSNSFLLSSISLCLDHNLPFSLYNFVLFYFVFPSVFLAFPFSHTLTSKSAVLLILPLTFSTIISSFSTSLPFFLINIWNHNKVNRKHRQLTVACTINLPWL